MRAEPLIVDAHVDVAWNAFHNARDLTLPVAELRDAEPDPSAVAMTSLADFGAAGVAVVFATLNVMPARLGPLGMDTDLPRPWRLYSSPEEAEAQALDLLRFYEDWENEGRIRVIRSRPDLETHLDRFGADRVPGFVITMESADPVRAPEDLPAWFERGVRMIGLAWESTRYAGGTGSSSGLTEIGRELVTAMADLGIVHDAVHLSEEAFWEAAGLPHHGLCVSHANPRALMLPPPGRRGEVPLNRYLSDEQIAEVARPHGAADRGVIGLALLNEFLDPRWDFSEAGRKTKVTIAGQGAAQLERFARIAGWESVGIGSDVDVAYGREETPADLDSVLDWKRIGDHVPAEARRGVLGENWLRFLRETLPDGER